MSIDTKEILKRRDELIKQMNGEPAQRPRTGMRAGCLIPLICLTID